VRPRGEIDAQLRNAYAGHADELLEEVSDLMDAQEWPPERIAARSGVCTGRIR